ncbi:MAG TPA: anti-sigma factor [Thermoanaerobaculia bacterium]|nr:anti-sigma factor [Thermoanaerobaculia bacterium]
MSCIGDGERREVQITAYLDDELDLTSVVELESHFERCPACAGELAAQRALKQAIGAADLRYRPGPDQVRRLRRQLGGGQAPPAWRVGPRLRAVAALLLVAVGSWTLGRRWPARPQVPGAERSDGVAGDAGPDASPLAEQVLASHVRAQLAGHPEDVASSDRHTVKPWFGGHLDYSPPVIDLAAQGFPLRGGRLDYVGGRPVAALVYQAGNHLVSVFVWPADGPGAAPTVRTGASPTGAPAAGGVPPAGAAVASSRRGFQQLRWTQAGMAWWAVSDVAADRLDDLVRALRAELPPAGPR